MATIVSDAFTAANGTALNAHTPNVGTSWGGDASSWAIQSNRAYLNATALSAAVGAPAASGNDYTVEADVRVVTIPATNTLFWGVGSHGSAGTNFGTQAILVVNSGGLDVTYQMRHSGALYTGPTVTGGGFSAGNDYHLKLVVAVTGTIYAATVYVTRASDGFYLKSDGTWQSGSVACITDSHDSSGLLPEPGNPALVAFDFGGSTVGVHLDNFLATEGGGGGVTLPALERMTRGIGRGSPGGVFSAPMRAQKCEQDDARTLRRAG